MNFLDLLFPQNCLECGSGGGYICLKCLNKVSYSTTMCPVCLMFSFYGKTHDTCRSKEGLDGLVTLWEHKGVVRKSISTVKYKFAYAVVPSITKVASIEIKKFKLPDCANVVASPLHKHRENWRGFNQSELYAQNFAKEMSWTYVEGLLKRTQDTTPQVHLQRTKRLRNIRGKIAVNTALLNKIDNNLTLFVVDDVWTTGATLRECGRVLKRAGVKEVWGLTIARA